MAIVDLSKQILNLSAQLGDTIILPLEWLDENDEALDLSGFSSWKLQTKDKAGEVVNTLTSGSGLSISSNVVTVTIPAQTEHLCLTWDLQATKSGGIRTYIGGTITYQTQVTT
jgi:hypothetical protein